MLVSLILVLLVISVSYIAYQIYTAPILEEEGVSREGTGKRE